MSAYIVVRMKVTDPEQYKRYAARTPDCVASFGGRFIARGGETVTLEGPEFSDRMVIIEFPSLEPGEGILQLAGIHRDQGAQGACRHRRVHRRGRGGLNPDAAIPAPPPRRYKIGLPAGRRERLP